MRSPVVRGTLGSLFVVLVAVACTAENAADGNDDVAEGGGGAPSAGGDGRGGAGDAPQGGDGGGGRDDEPSGGAAGESSGGTGGATVGTGGTAAGGAAGMTGGAGGTAMAGGTAGSTAPPPVMNKAPRYSQDFEGVATGQTPGGPFSNPRGVAVSEEQAFSGKKSLKLSTGNEIRFNNRQVIGSGKSYYLRFMLWMDNHPLGNNGHYDMINFEGRFTGNGQTMFGFYSFGGFNGGMGSHKVQIYGNVSGRIADCAKSAMPLQIKPKQWHCVELKIDDMDVLNYGVFIDGKEIQNFSFPFDFAGSSCVPGQNPTMGKWYVPDVSFIKFNMRPIQNQPRVTTYFDDVAFSNSPIGCPKSP